MQFDKPATTNPIDRLTAVGRPIRRIDGELKTSGRAKCAYEWHDPDIRYAYGYPVGSSIAKGRIISMDTSAAKKAPGVIAVVTAPEIGERKKGEHNIARLFGGNVVQHYHQAVAVVVTETFEQARAAAALVKVEYDEENGVYDLAQAKGSAIKPDDSQQPDTAVGDFDAAFKSAAVRLDETYMTPDQSQAMMEPHSSIAAWMVMR